MKTLFKNDELKEVSFTQENENFIEMLNHTIEMVNTCGNGYLRSNLHTDNSLRIEAKNNICIFPIPQIIGVVIRETTVFIRVKDNIGVTLFFADYSFCIQQFNETV